MKSARSMRLGGALFGAWLALVYAFVSVQINISALPGIPLPEPKGGTFGFFLGYLAGGVLIGLLSCWPESRWSGALLGALGGTLAVFYLPWQNAFQSQNAAMGTILLTLTTFLPMIIFLFPLALGVRWVVDNFPVQIEGALNLRRIGPPLAATLLAVLLGSTALYPPEVKNAFYLTQGLVESGLKATSRAGLPEPLQSTVYWFPRATGKYTLEMSEEVNRFTGQVPIGTRQGGDFLIIVRFQNGYAMACIFVPNVKIPSCADFE